MTRRGDCADSGTARAPKTKARLSVELLHTFLYDRQTYFQRAVGDRAWGEVPVNMTSFEAER